MNRLFEVAVVIPPKGLSTAQMAYLIHELNWLRNHLGKADPPWVMQMVYTATGDMSWPEVLPADVEAVLRHKVPGKWRALPPYTSHQKHDSTFAFLLGELKECAVVYCCIAEGESNHGRSRPARLFRYAQEHGGKAAVRFKLVSDAVERPSAESTGKLARAKRG